jgi:hypothetical protein
MTPRNEFENRDEPIEELVDDSDDFPLDIYQEARKDLLRDLEQMQLREGHSATRVEQSRSLKQSISDAGG